MPDSAVRSCARRVTVGSLVTCLAAGVATAAVAFSGGSAAGAAAGAGRDPIGAANVAVQGATATFNGYALDPDQPGTPVVVVGLLDGDETSAAATNLPLQTVTDRYRANATPGFSTAVTAPADGRSHSACLGVRNLRGGLAAILKCTSVGRGRPASSASHSPFGTAAYSRSGRTITFTGNASDPDYRNRPVAVYLYLDSRFVARTTTRYVAGARPAGTGLSSSYRISARVGSKLAHTACVRVLDVGPGGHTTIRCQRFDLKSHRADTLTGSEARRMSRVVALARKQFDKPYVWAAAGPRAFDCSGLVQWTYRRNGLRPLRIAQDQFATSHIVSAASVRPGDLVFYYDAFGYVHHVGIYVRPGMTIAAMSPRLCIGWQSYSATPAPDGSGVSFGSYTHT